MNYPLVWRTGALLAGLLMLSLPGLAKDRAYVQPFIGAVDLGQPQKDSQYRVQYISGQGWTRFDLQPHLGLLRTRHGSHLLYTGVSRYSSFAPGDEGLALVVEFGPGLYLHGGGADTDLGFPLQFRTSGGLVYEFADATRVGVHFSHLYNASLAEENPGTELLTFTYGLAF